MLSCLLQTTLSVGKLSTFVNLSASPWMEIAIKVECICKIRSGEFSCDKKTVLVRTRVRCTSMKRAAGTICTQLTLPHGVVEGLIY